MIRSFEISGRTYFPALSLPHTLAHTLLPALCAAAMLLAGTASAAVQYVKLGARATDNGSSWANAYETLTNAIARAPGGTEFWICQGVYTNGPGETNTFDIGGNTYYGGFAGTETALGQRNWSNNVTVLTGGATNTRHIVTKSTAGAAVLDGLTIRGGTNSLEADFEAPSTDPNGVGILMTSGSLTVANCILSNNYANAYGGGAYVGWNLTAMFTNTLFIANTAHAAAGAYLYAATSVFARCVFTNNAQEGSGAMWRSGPAVLASFGSASFRDCRFLDNKAGDPNCWCGAIYIGSASCGFSNCEFIGNRGTNVAGAIYYARGVGVFSNCTFNDNTAWGPSYRGAGAIYFYSPGAGSMLDGCSFMANNSGSGDGGALLIDGGERMTVRNCAFIGNRGANGGAIKANSSAGAINCTFFTNTATANGGAIHVAGGRALDATNCAFWKNGSAGPGPEIYNEGTVNIGYSDVDLARVVGGTVNAGAGIVNADPLFASEVPPYDLHEKSLWGRYSGGAWLFDAEHSPCINAGDPSSDWSLEPAPNGERVNIGAWGNTAQASKGSYFAPVVDNDGGATHLTATKARLNGTLTSDGGGMTYVWVYWGAADGGTVKSAWQYNAGLGARPVGSFTNPVAGLTASTPYYYRCYASNSGAEAWAPATSGFTTPDASGTNVQRGLRMKITFPGYNPPGGGSLTDFPLLVTFSNNINNSGFDYSTMLSTNGWDLRFWDASRTQELSYEVEQWATNSNSCVWVKVPLISSASDYIWATWDNPAYTNRPAYTTNGDVWTQGYLGVWHLRENEQNETTPTVPYLDATTNNRTGWFDYDTHGGGLFAPGPRSKLGVIANGQEFKGANDSVGGYYCPDGLLMPSTANPGSADFTISWWEKLNFHANVGYWGAGHPQWLANGGGSWTIKESDGGYAFFMCGAVTCKSAAPMLPKYEWTYVTFTRRGNSAYWYANGLQVGSAFDVTGMSLGSSPGFYMGDFVNGYFQCTAGHIDEPRFMLGSQTPQWIWACWMNQGSNSVFNSPGVVQSEGPPSLKPGPGAAGITDSSAWLSATLISTGMSATEVWCYWGVSDGGMEPAAWAYSRSFGVITDPVPPSRSYSNSAAGLSAGTLYYYTHCAANASGEVWCVSRSFKTLGQPAVNNGGGASNSAPRIAALRGVLTQGSSADVYVYWGETDGGVNKGAWRNAVFVGTLEEGAFSTVATGLVYGVRYYYRCYAVNVIGEAWAPASENFTTLRPVGPAAPPVTSGLELWLDAGAVTGLSDGETVVTWYDQSGKGRHTTGRLGDPAYRASVATLSNKPAIRFNGYSGFKLGDLSAAFPSAATLFVVADLNGDAGYNLYSTRNNDCWWRNGNGLGYNGAFRAGRAQGYPAMPSAGQHVFMIESSAGPYDIDDNGARILNDYPAAFAGGDDHRIGMHDNGDSSKYLDGYIAEVAIYNRVLSSNEQQQVGGYLALKYGLATCYSIGPYVDIVNGAVSSLAANSATLNAVLYCSDSTFQVYAHWGTANGGASAAAWGNSAYLGSYTNVASAALARPVTGLAGDTLYYFTFRGVNEAGEMWATNPATFITGGVALQATDAGASETGPDAGAFTVTRPAGAVSGPLTVYYSIGGAAGNGVDYQALGGSVVIPEGSASAAIAVTPIPDMEWAEPAETVALALLPGGYVIGAPGGGTVTIANDSHALVKYVDGDAAGADDGSSWANAYKTLTNAIAKAPAGSGFWIADGVYTPGAAAAATFNMGNNAFFGGFAGTETDFSGRNWSNNVTILSGNLGGGAYAMHVTTKNTAGAAILDGLWVQEGRDGGQSGAGILHTAGWLTIRNCTFSNNAASGHGGAIYSSAGVVSNTFSNCVFRGNTAVNHGGSIFMNGGGLLRLEDCSFQGCSAAAGVGGAVYIDGRTQFERCLFLDNDAVGTGGALHNTAGFATCTFRNCAFVDNSSSASGGGGALYFEGSDAARKILNCTFFRNRASAGPGGAIRATAGSLAVTNTILWGDSGVSAREISTAGILDMGYSDVNTNDVTAGARTLRAGIFATNPLFAAESEPYDVHVKSTGGRYDPFLGKWVEDPVFSPCIDAGDPAFDYSLEPPSNGWRINLGAYGNTPEASRSGYVGPMILLVR